MSSRYGFALALAAAAMIAGTARAGELRPLPRQRQAASAPAPAGGKDMPAIGPRIDFPDGSLAAKSLPPRRAPRAVYNA